MNTKVAADTTVIVLTAIAGVIVTGSIVKGLLISALTVGLRFLVGGVALAIAAMLPN